MTTGERMRARRKEIGLSAETVAELLKVSPATVYRYEKGDIEKLPGSFLEPLADILCTTPAYLMGWEESTSYTSKNSSTISNSAIIQGNSSGNVNISNSSNGFLSEQEEELLRIFRGLTFRSKTKLISLAFQIEDEDKVRQS